MEIYLKYARIAYIQMLKDIKPISNYVIDGSKDLESIVEEILLLSEKCKKYDTIC